MPIRFPHFAIPLLAATLAVSSPALAQPSHQSFAPTNWKLTPAQAQQWVARLKELCPKQGWTVSAQGNDIIIVRTQPVAFTQRPASYPVGARRPKGPTTKAPFRITLRFGPQMKLNEYDALKGVNAITETEDQVLLSEFGLLRRASELVSDGKKHDQPESERKQQYLKFSVDLIFVDTPDYYTPDASITTYRSWRSNQYLDSGNPQVDKECNEVRDKIAGYFGSYNRLSGQPDTPFGYEELPAK